MNRVLIVDDSELILAQLTDIVTELGFMVAGQAKSGSDAVQSAKTLRPDIVLMDIIMPGSLDGIEAGRRIREELDIPVVFLTGHDDYPLMAGAKEAGANGYLLKPVNPPELKATIEIALHKNRSDGELNRFYREVIENTNDLVYVVDGQGNIKYANDQILRIAGYQKKEEIIGKSFASFLTPQSLAYSAELFKRQVKGEDVGLFEFDVIDSNGNGHTIEIRERVVWKGDKIVEIHGIGRDVTDRKMTEEELKEKERRLAETNKMLQLILDTIPVRIFWKDLNSTYLGCNLHFARDAGRSSPLDIVGDTDHNLGWRQQADTYRADDQEVIGTGIPKLNYEEPQDTPDGSRIWLKTSKVPLRDLEDRVIGILGSYEDISERKRAEEALKESEEKYRQVVENAQEAIVVFVDGIVVYANPMTEKMTGYSIEELKGKTLGEISLPEDDEPAGREFRRKLLGDSLTYPSEYRYLKKTGETGWYEAIAVAITWEGKQGLMVFAREITERKKMEEQFLQAQKMKAIGAMAGGIAHNFNNILVGIMGYSEYLLSKRSEDDPDYKALKTIFDGTMKASQLTRQLLNVTRAGEYQLSRCDINSIVDRVLPLVTGTFDKSVTIGTNLGLNLPSFNANSVQLEQCLLNLCFNARDAMPSGGTLTIETCVKELDDGFVRTHIGSQPGKHLVLTVSDNGTGMSPEVKERIFEPFFTTKPDNVGTGMGLSTVYGTVKKHGGFITVYSELGEGTTFRLYFPVTRGTVIASRVPDSIREERGHETILIIDDEQVVREVWAEYLRNIGYVVMLAENGTEGISLLLQNKDAVNLVILDVIMPKMGGRDALKKIREIDPTKKILIASGYSEDGKAGEVITERVDGFIQKPTTLRELSEKVRRALDGIEQ